MARNSTETDRDPFADPGADAHLRALRPRQRQFVELMVWEGLSHVRAAEKLRVPDRTARYWMRQPAILGAIEVENKVLRASARARNLHRLEAIRDQDRNLAAAVAAARVIEERGEADLVRVPNQRVGYVVVLNGAQPQRLSSDAGQVIEGFGIVDVTSRRALTRSAPAGLPVDDAETVDVVGD